MQQLLRIISKTWERDSNGLFDYEILHNTSIYLNLNSSCYVSREGNFIHSSLDKISFSSEYLFDVKQSKSNNEFLISNICLTNQNPTIDSINNLSHKIWYVIPKGNNFTSNNIINTNEDYFLTINDIFKLGRINFKIAECSFIPNPKHFIPGNYNLSYINSTTSPVFKNISLLNEITSNSNECVCKICYSNETSQNDPLINLCLFKGGIGQVHYSCIKSWMSTKLIVNENESQNVKSYIIKRFNCEICGTPFQRQFQIKGSDRIYSLIDIERPDNEDYVILESLNQIKDNANIKTIHVITLNRNKFVIGRGNESDIRVNDISVSRTHALLMFDKKEKTLMLEDMKSKFGTLVLIKYPLRILHKPLTFQVGRTLIESQVVNACEKIITNNINNNIAKLEHLNHNDINNKDEGEHKDKSINDNEHNQNKNKGNNSNDNIV